MIAKMIVTAAVFAALHTIGMPQRPVRPDPRLTPGAATATATADVCRPGYARQTRNVPSSVKRQALAEYGIVPLPGERFEIDHLVPLELGGANTLANLWPQPYAGAWTAGEKDRLENALHREVCADQEPLGDAQQEIRADWIGAYTRRYSTGGNVYGH